MAKFFVIAFFTCATMIAQENRYVHGTYEFKAESTEYLFGDNVKLRVEPTTTSEVIQLLPIASAIKILEKTDITFSFNGLTHPGTK